MQLFLSNHYDRLRDNGRLSQQGLDHYPVTKLILPGTGCTWLLTEIRPEQNSRFAYGIADYGYNSIHQGYINLEAVFAMSDPVFGERVKEDLTFRTKYPISAYLIAARMREYITDDERHLEQALRWTNHDWQQKQPHRSSPLVLKMPTP